MPILLHALSGLLDMNWLVQAWSLAGATLAFAARRDELRRESAQERGRVAPRRARLSPTFTAVLVGIGAAGFVDEAVFHQILQWHNFYWDTSQNGRILSDGLFHVFSTSLLLWGTLRLWFGTRPDGRTLLGGALMGAGGFNAYDGLVQHVLLHFHLVNERVCPFPESGGNSVFTCPQDVPFEVAWIAVGIGVFLAGVYIWRSARAGG